MEQVAAAWRKLEEEYERIEADRRDVIAENERLHDELKKSRSPGFNVTVNYAEAKTEMEKWKKEKLGEVEKARKELNAEKQEFDQMKRELETELADLREQVKYTSKGIAPPSLSMPGTAEEREALNEDMAKFELAKKVRRRLFSLARISPLTRFFPLDRPFWKRQNG